MKMKNSSSGMENADKTNLLKLLKDENQYILNLFTTFNVPETVDLDDELDDYLTNKTVKLPLIKYTKREEKEDHVDTIVREKILKNKNISRKGGQQIMKRPKDLKQKRQMISAAKSIKNEQVKEEKLVETVEIVKPKLEFNKDSKILFSKIDFPKVGLKSDRPKNKKKKNKLDKIEKNPLKLIKNLEAQKNEIAELKASGEEEKANELKQKIAWKKAFDKTDGKKIKDNPKLIMKVLTKRRHQKKKSKDNWKKREEIVQQDKDQRQKKRETNIQKKKDEKQTRRKKLRNKRLLK